MDTPLRAREGLYDARFEHDSCGIGFIADMHGRPSHDIVRMGATALANLTHRGAVAADGQSCDGAGLLMQIPRSFFQDELGRLGLECPGDSLGVGMVFLPAGDGDAGVDLIEKQILRSGLRVVGWRAVPTDITVLGPLARASCPVIRQVLIGRPLGVTAGDAFERQLYLARKRIERAAATGDIAVYVASLSSRTITYKGLMAPSRIADFYLDLAAPSFASAITMFHQRYSTNTLPAWKLAQPFRMLAHNGEINTLEGNVRRWCAGESTLTSPVWGTDIQDLLPVIAEGHSDSAALDQVLEFLTMSGRDVVHAMMMLVPEAYQHMDDMAPEVQAFFEYHATMMAPWDGPASLVFTDGHVVSAALDRNGLRPLRFWVTDNDLVIVGSESGVVPMSGAAVTHSGRLPPGKMLAVDTRTGQFVEDEPLKLRCARRRPYRQWLDQWMIKPPPRTGVANVPPRRSTKELVRAQVAFGYCREDLERVLIPLAYEARQPIGSMGDDTPIAVLSSQPKSIYCYFKQRFAQVTNPPIDSLRERLVMSRRMALGRRACILDESDQASSLVKFDTPIVTTDQLDWLLSLGDDRFQHGVVDCLFDVRAGENGLHPALEDVCARVEALIDQGCALIVLSDRNIGPDRAAIPMLLAAGAVHNHLIRAGKRLMASVICDVGDVVSDHHLACLFGYGVALVHPYLALEVIAQIVRDDPRGTGITLEQGLNNFQRAMEEGVLKILAKRGISTIASYRGAQAFEAIGISNEVIERHFTGTVSSIGGVGLRELASDIVVLHERAFDDAAPQLHRSGAFVNHRQGEYHATQPAMTKTLHRAVRHGDRAAFDDYSRLVDERPPCHLRDLLVWRRRDQPVSLADVEPAEQIAQRFCTQAMSHGAVSREAHEVLAVAMNSIGGKSNSGEGGEDAQRFGPVGDGHTGLLSAWQPRVGDLANSAIKQIASGRFGVTPEYLVSAGELEIKIAQGAKPGEGGQIPGHKVTAEIARLRCATPGVPLISPPPHHDIYSIEDLSQLIHDLKQINPHARVGVKLVATSGIGTIAAGVAKAYADVIQVSGYDGGTGASPLSSLKNTGLPWELGLAEVQQVLVRNELRGRVRLRVDGGLKTGRDVLIAAMLGADEYGFGTAALLAAGCVMVRRCHLNDCPVGIATQREDLRRKFPGRPEHVVAMMMYVAEQVRLGLAELGVERLDDVIGRVDLLHARHAQLPKGIALDLTGLLASPVPAPAVRRTQQRNDPPADSDDLDRRVEADCRDAVKHCRPLVRRYAISNRARSVGASLSGAIARTTADRGLPEDCITLHFEGVAGQSLGAFNNRGMTIHLLGEAQDYVAKSMCGGTLSISPADSSRLRLDDDKVIMGNTVLYGATGGYLFAAGKAGERFAVRNSGAVAVVAGCGDHGCEYMTGGIVLVLGNTGRNFGAGMTGGVAYVLDEHGLLPTRRHDDSVVERAVNDHVDDQLIVALINRHRNLTTSTRAAWILEHWDVVRTWMRVVTPRSASATLLQRTADTKSDTIQALTHANRRPLAG